MKKVLSIFILIGFVWTLKAGEPDFSKPMEKWKEKDAQIYLQQKKQELQDLENQLQTLQKKWDSLNLILEELNKQASELEAEINELKAEINKYPTEYTVKKGDCLWKIAGMPYIYNNPIRWPRIYRANIDKIKDPNLIYPNWVLKIPHGLAKTITVIPGDCLWKIAGLYWVYNNPWQWTKIYEANKDKIKDPDLIYPGQEFTIPR